METKEGFELSNNGHEEATEDSQEQLSSVMLQLDKLARPDGSVVTMGKQELSLLKSMLLTASEDYREQTIWRMCDFLDEDEAHNHVSAYYAAKDLGMDTGFNVAYMFALCSTNRRGNKTNLLALLTDTLQHGKWAPSNGKGKHDGNSNPRSPLSGGGN